MRYLVICLLLLTSCVASARRWHVDNVNNAVSKHSMEVAMIYLEMAWGRWPQVSFTMTPDDKTNGVIEINNIEGKGTTLGRAMFGSSYLRGPYQGVFSKYINDLKLDDQQTGRYLAVVISHEIGHAYGIMFHIESNTIMHATSGPATPLVWDKSDQDYLDNVFWGK